LFGGLRPYQRKMLTLAIGLASAYLFIMGLRIIQNFEKQAPVVEQTTPAVVGAPPAGGTESVDKAEVIRELQKKVDELKNLLDKL
jgi:hypothetical protein